MAASFVLYFFLLILIIFPYGWIMVLCKSSQRLQSALAPNSIFCLQSFSSFFFFQFSWIFLNEYSPNTCSAAHSFFSYWQRKIYKSIRSQITPRNFKGLYSCYITLLIKSVESDASFFKSGQIEKRCDPSFIMSDLLARTSKKLFSCNLCCKHRPQRWSFIYFNYRSCWRFFRRQAKNLDSITMRHFPISIDSKIY